MDFNTLSRKDLQTLCKKNKIPANITNVAMVAALAALPQVEGLDEILNPREGDIGTPSIQIRSASRTTTQRKAVKEPESSKVSTRPSRGTRTRVAEGVAEQENKDANVPATPAMVPGSRRRVPAASTRRKKEVVEDVDDGKDGVQEKPKDVPKTPGVAPSSRKRATGRSVCNKNETPSGTSVQKGYSTRRSVRLLGKSLYEMSLVVTEDMGLDKKTDDASEELSNVSQQVEDSSNTEMGDSMQTLSTVVSESIDESDVSSLNKNEDEGQSRDLGSEVLSNVSQHVEDSSNTEMEASMQTLSTMLSESIDESDVSSLNKYDDEGQSHDLDSEEKLVSGKESDVQDELQAEPQEDGSGKVNHVDAEPKDFSPALQGNCDQCGDSNEAGSNEAGSELLPELEDSGDSAKLESKECDETKQDAISFEACEEASMEIADEKDVSSTEEVLENVADNANHIENFEPMHDDIDECGDSNEAGSELLLELEDSDDSAKQENKECDETKQDAISFEECEEASMEIADNKDVSITERVLENVADGNVNHIENFEPMHDDIDESAANMDVLRTEGVLEKDSSSSEDRQEEALELKPELQEDETSGNSGGLGKVCFDVEDATVQLSFLGEAQKAEDQISEKVEVEAQAEESEVAAQAEESEVAAGEDDTLIVDGNSFSHVADGTEMAFYNQQVEANGTSNTLVETMAEKLEAEAQAEESEVAAGEDETVVADGTEMSFYNNQQVEFNGISNTLVKADGETNGSETVAVAQLNEHEISVVAIEPVVSESLCTVQSEETKEIQTVTNIMKENLIIDFQKMSIRGLKKKLKELDAKPKGITDNDAATCLQEGERKRTALQALPPNQLTTGEAQSDV